MTSLSPLVTLSPRDYDAVVFGLDGVLTATAPVHAAAWKQLFDPLLAQRAADAGEAFVAFDREADYRRYVDGKPREDSVVAFLASRGITIPAGTAEDPLDAHTVSALGRLQDQYFLHHLAHYGVNPDDAACTFVRTLRAHAVKTAVVSSSTHGADVLAAAGLASLFEARVDGRELTRLALQGTPAPDALLEAAQRLQVDPARTVVVEDAIAGVTAARAGRFGYIIGVDGGGQAQQLQEAGADVVVTSLAQIQVAVEPPSAWSLVFDGFDPAQEGIREALCALGNGYVTTRAAVPWAVADAVHYPGTYLAGGYNRLRTTIAGQEVENEDLVNWPNWLTLSFRIADGAWFDLRTVTLLSYHQELDLQGGLLIRTLGFADAEGRRTTLKERRLVSMCDMHLGALELTLTAENWSAPVTVRTAIDGRVVNRGAQLYRPFNNTHLEPLGSGVVGADGVALLVRACQSSLHVAQAARTQAFVNGQLCERARQVCEDPGYIGQELAIDLQQGDTLVLEKLVAWYTSRDPAISECGLAARQALTRARRFEAVLAEHRVAWQYLWRHFDVHLQPTGPAFTLNVPMLLRLNMLHLLQAVSPNSIGLDIGVPPRGWTGEAYQGHIFWDELFIFPFLNYRMPEITRSLLLYRYRRLGAAREAARRVGFHGAMFPWQSGSDGQEETQDLNLNPRSQRWVPDHSYLQRHVGSAIAYNVWQYFQVTHDIEFLQAYGAELLLEIARFWSSLAHFNEALGRYEIHGVMGPNEFHEGYPDASTPGLKNNAYTNLMAVWVLCRALDVLALLPDLRRAELLTRLGLSADECTRWGEISRKMYVPFHGDGIISQFEGYDHLAELDWEGYRTRYGNIQRLDLILEAEQDSANRYKLSKQADVLMVFYLLSAEELGALFARLGYPFDAETIPRNVAYYDSRSSHGSTLSRVVHAWVLARVDRPRALTYFAEALQSDVSDIQQGTTAEGVHLGAMASTVDLVQRVATGIEVTGDVLRFNPHLPEELARLDMRMRYREHTLDLRLTRTALTVRGRERGAAPIQLGFKNDVYTFTGGSTQVFPLD